MLKSVQVGKTYFINLWIILGKIILKKPFRGFDMIFYRAKKAFFELFRLKKILPPEKMTSLPFNFKRTVKVVEYLPQTNWRHHSLNSRTFRVYGLTPGILQDVIKH